MRSAKTDSFANLLTHRALVFRHPHLRPDNEEPPASLSQAYTSRLNQFISTCPSLKKISAPNYAAHSILTGPSIFAPQVTELSITTPLLICQDKPLRQAFPNLQKLVWKEMEPGLMLISGGNECKAGKCKPSRMKAYRHMLKGQLSTVTELDLEIVTAGQQSWEVQPTTFLGHWAKQRNLKELIGRFPSLQRLTLRFTGPCLEYKGGFPYDMVSYR